MKDALHDLLEKYLSDELDSDDRQALVTQLERPDCRRDFAEHVQWSAMIARGARKLAGRMAEMGPEPQPAVQEETPEPEMPSRPALRYFATAVISAAATLLLVLGIQFALSPAQPPPPAGFATLCLAGADVYVMREGRTFKAESGARIHRGDLLEVVGGGISTVQYDGENTFVRLQSGTQATFSKQATDSKHIHLLRGRIAASVSPQPDESPMRITALHTEATVLGTRFALAVNEKRALLGVEKGSVRLAHLGSGDAVKVEAGHAAATTASRLVPPALDVDFIKALRGHWTLDDLGGKVAVDDSMGFSDGIVSNPEWVAGHMGGALRLDSGCDGVLIAPGDCGNVGSNSFVLSLWISPGDEIGVGNLICKRDQEGVGYALTFDQGRHILCFSVSDGVASCAVRSNLLNLQPKRFYHLMAVADRGRKRLSLVVNGVVVTTGECAALTGSTDNDAAILIAGSDTCDGFVGTIDDVRIYASALSDEELADLQQKAEHYPIAPTGTTIFIE